MRGNHDHFWTGFLRVDDYLRATYTGETILDLGNVFEDPLGPDSRGFYMGCLDGRTPHGDIFGLGPVADFATPPKVLAADPDRRSLTKSDWMREFFETSSTPAGHGFDEAAVESGFACYTFEPKPGVPLRVLVLDDTQRDDDPYDNGYGHISLDKERHDWLFRELDRGQADGVLMIIAAHCPIGVEKPPHPMSWSSSAYGTEEDVLAKLHSCPNLILWIAGHRHCNAVTAFPSPDEDRPELGFWEVETASLRDFPQQLRTFEILRNERRQRHDQGGRRRHGGRGRLTGRDVTHVCGRGPADLRQRPRLSAERRVQRRPRRAAQRGHAREARAPAGGMSVGRDA